VRLDAREPGQGVDGERVELGIDRGELGIDRGELGIDRGELGFDRGELDRDLFDPALEPIEPGLDAIAALEERDLAFGDRVHAGLDALQHGFEASAVGSGHEWAGPYAGRENVVKPGSGSNRPPRDEHRVIVLPLAAIDHHGPRLAAPR
jgi:hypothetical protein